MLVCESKVCSEFVIHSHQVSIIQHTWHTCTQHMLNYSFVGRPHKSNQQTGRAQSADDMAFCCVYTQAWQKCKRCGLFPGLTWSHCSPDNNHCINSPSIFILGWSTQQYPTCATNGYDSHLSLMCVILEGLIFIISSSGHYTLPTT